MISADENSDRPKTCTACRARKTGWRERWGKWRGGREVGRSGWGLREVDGGRGGLVAEASSI